MPADAVGHDPSTNSTPTVTGARIAARGVHKTYRSGDERTVQALRGVDLHIDRPGFFAIMGPSGSGKSTLLHLLAGLDRPDEGSISVAGEDITAATEAELTVFRRRRIGIVFQQFNLMPTLTALENVALPALLDGMPEAKRRARASELLDALGLAERGTHRPAAMSGGEQQRVAIARALFFEPTILFADEPTGNLDSASSAAMWQLLRDVAARHQLTVLMVTHEPSAAAHCEQIYLMRDGRIADQFDPSGMDHAALSAHLIGEAQVAHA